MKVLVVVPLFVGFMASSNAFAECDNVPAKVAAYVATRPGWHVIHLADLGSDDQALWSRYRGDACPGFARADLQGKGRWSYGLSLSKGSDTQSIILYDDGNTMREKVLPADAGVVRHVVHAAPPGPTSRFGIPKHIDIPHESLVFEVLESSAVQYYWRNGRLVDITISD